MHNANTVQILQHRQQLGQQLGDLCFRKAVGILPAAIQQLVIRRSLDIVLHQKQLIAIPQQFSKFGNLRMVELVENAGLALKHRLGLV
jgi:hypothetical protein